MQGGGAGPVPKKSLSPRSAKKNFVDINRRAYSKVSINSSGAGDDNADGTGGSGETSHARALIPSYLSKGSMDSKRNQVLRQIEEQ